MAKIFIIFLCLGIWFVVFILIHSIVKYFVRYLNKNLEKLAVNIKKDKKFKKLRDKESNDEIKRLLYVLRKKSVGSKKIDFNFTTRRITFIETLLFSTLTFFLLSFPCFFSRSIFEVLLIVAFGWIGLKIFGSYRQWEGALLGRAYSYNFLLGSIANIFFSISLGWLIYFLLIHIH